jgi:hypothetical protein
MPTTPTVIGRRVSKCLGSSFLFFSSFHEPKNTPAYLVLNGTAKPVLIMVSLGRRKRIRDAIHAKSNDIQNAIEDHDWPSDTKMVANPTDNSHPLVLSAVQLDSFT